LTGCSIKGLKYKFPSLILQPNQFWVIAQYYEDFKKVYGVPPSDTYTGVLGSSSDGDLFRIVDSVGNNVFELDYKVSLPWTYLPDGYGYSLVADAQRYNDIILSTNGRSKSYRYSTNVKGSPFADDPNPDWSVRDVKIRFNFVSYEDGWIEFINPTNNVIDVSRWAIYHQGNVIATIPSGTKINGGSTFKQKAKGLKRGPRIALYKLDQPLSQVNNKKIYTGDFIEFDSNDNELAI